MLEKRFLEYLEKEKRYSKHTIIAYKKDIEQLDSFLHSAYQVGWSETTSQMLRSWIVALMEEGVSAKTINRKISTTKSLFNYLVKEGWLNNNPTSQLISPKVEKPLPVFIKTSEMNELLAEFNFGNDFEGERDALIIETLYACGLRLSELIGVQEKDVDLKGGTMKVLGKRNKERMVPLHAPLIERMQRYIDLKHEQYNSAYFFLTDKGEKLYPKFVYRKVNYYLSQVTTTKKKSPHILRHTFATHMLNNGADLNTIKEILGHANLSATEIYTHNSIEKLKKIYNQAHPRA